MSPSPPSKALIRTVLVPHSMLTERAARCDLIAHQIAVKAKYELWVTPPEAEAMQRVLSACPGQSLPTEGQAATPATN